MSAPSTTPSTTFESSSAWYGGRKAIRYRQRVAITHGSTHSSVGWTVPAKARVVHTHCRNAVTNNAISGGIGTTAPNAIALMMYPVSAATVTTPLTAPIQTTQSAPAGTNGIMLALIPGTGTTESNGIFRGPPFVSGYTTNGSTAGHNTNAAAAYLALQPAHTSSQRVAWSTTMTDTTVCYFFGTSSTANTNSDGSIDVVMYVETFDDYPS